jgi:hypothetical protein
MVCPFPGNGFSPAKKPFFQFLSIFSWLILWMLLFVRGINRLWTFQCEFWATVCDWITIHFVSPSDFHRSSQSLRFLDPMAIKRLGNDPNALKNGNAIHGLSLFPVEEMESCRRKEKCRQVIRSETGTTYRGCGRFSASGLLFLLSFQWLSQWQFPFSSIWSTKIWYSNLCFSLFLPARKKEDLEVNYVSSCSIALGSPWNECILSQHVMPEQRSFLFPFWDGTRCSDNRHGELNFSREK